MMTWRVAVVVQLLIGGCAHDEGDQRDPPGSVCEVIGGDPVRDGATIHGIDYAVLGGFSGHGDGTELRIAADGTFTRQTVLHGAEQGQLDQGTLGDLASKVRAAKFPTLCATYACTSCGDDFVHEVSVQLDASTYTVQASEFASPPERLAVLIEALQAIVEGPLR